MKDYDINQLLSPADRAAIEQHYAAAKTVSTAPARCRWWRRHPWSKWWITRKGRVTNEEGRLIGHYIDQQRICLECHRLEMRSVTE